MPTPFSNDLPRGWVRTTLEEISEIILGQSPPSSTYNTDGKGLPFYQGKLEFGKLYPTPRKWCTAPKKIAEKGDVFISIRAPVGPTNLCPEKSAVGRGLAAIRGLGGIQSFFILYLIRRFENEIANKGTGTTFNAITGNQLKNFEIPVPPLAEQRRIVAKLDTLFTQLDAAVDSLKQTQTQLQRYRRSILKAAFEGELTRKGSDRRAEKAGKDIGECIDAVWIERKGAAINKKTSPERWEVVQLKETANLRREKVQPKDSSENLNFVGLKHIDSGVSILKRWGDASEVKSTKSRFYPNDVLYGKLRSYLDKAVIAEMEGICSADILVFNTNSKMIPRFLVYLLHSQKFRNYAIATSSGITLPRTSWNALGEFTFALPPLAEQEQIVSELERCFSIADEVEATIAFELVRAEHLRHSILKHAFSGKLVPQDPNDEPASILLEKIRGEKKQQPKQRKKTAKSKAQDSDDYPLLALAGALEQNDDSIGDASLVELRGDKGE